MTDEQNIMNRDLIIKHSLYPQRSVYEETIYVIRNLSYFAARRTLFTNEHKSKAKAYRSFDCLMDLKIISSKARRDSSHPLYPINRLCWRSFNR